MFLVFVQNGRIIEVRDDAVDPGSDKTLGRQLAEDVQVFSFAIADDGCQQVDPGAFRQAQDMIYHLADRLRFQFDAMCRTVRFADPGKQQPQVIVDLGDGAYR